MCSGPSARINARSVSARSTWLARRRVTLPISPASWPVSQRGQAASRSRACFSVRVSLTAREFPTCSDGCGIIARRRLGYSSSGSGVGWWSAACFARRPSQPIMASRDTSGVTVSGRKERLPPPHCCQTGAWTSPASNSPSVAAKVLRCSLGSPKERKARRVAWSEWVSTSVAVGRWRWCRFSKVRRR